MLVVGKWTPAASYCWGGGISPNRSPGFPAHVVNGFQQHLYTNQEPLVPGIWALL